MPNDQRKRGRPWRRIREHVLARDGHRCQLRYPDVCTTYATQVDHIESILINPSRQLDPTNCRAVCESCHKHRTGLQAGGNDRAPHLPPSRDW